MSSGTQTTDTFTHDCADCGGPRRVVKGRERRHRCPTPRRLRGRVQRAEAEMMRWTCEQAGHPKQLPEDGACICGTWARHVEAGAVEIDCVRSTDEHK